MLTLSISHDDNQSARRNLPYGRRLCSPKKGLRGPQDESDVGRSAWSRSRRADDAAAGRPKWFPWA